jgi:hypothetical protein
LILAYWRARHCPRQLSKESQTFPVRLATLKDIFEPVCDEVAIPPDASSVQDALATKILRAGEAIESEMILALTAIQTAMKGRR